MPQLDELTLKYWTAVKHLREHPGKGPDLAHKLLSYIAANSSGALQNRASEANAGKDEARIVYDG